MFNKRKVYPSDLSDREWETLRPLLPPGKARGRKRSVNLREIVSTTTLLWPIVAEGAAATFAVGTIGGTVLPLDALDFCQGTLRIELAFG